MKTFTLLPALFALSLALLHTLAPSRLGAAVTTVTITSDSTATARYTVAASNTLIFDVSADTVYTIDNLAAAANSAVTLAANSVFKIQGGGTTVFTSNTATIRGAAINAVATGVTMDFTNVIFGDKANLDLGNAGIGGGAFIINQGVLTLTNGGFYGNKGTTSAQNGGALYLASSRCTLTDVVFEGNSHTLLVGGGIFFSSGTLQLINARFGVLGDATRANKAVRGGAIYANGGMLDVTNGEFYGNIASSSTGGAIYAVASVTGSLTNVVFAENSAGQDGGALALHSTAGIPITSATFGVLNDPSRGNTAGANGGAIYLGSGQLLLTNAEFYGNRSGTSGNGSGGAIFSGATSTSGTLSNVIFKQNSAAGQGGAIYWGGGGMIIDNALFSSNTATNGGAMSVNGAQASVSLINANFTDNVATGAGGALSVRAGTVHLTATANTNYTGNTAASEGGFLHITDGGVVDIQATVGSTLTIGGTNSTEDTISSGTHTNTVIGINTLGAHGSVIFKSDNSAYRGRVDVNSGSLLLGGADAKLGGLISVKNGGVFGGWGTVDVNDGVNRHVSVADGGTLQIGLNGATGGAQTLTLTGALAMASGAAITGDGTLDVSGPSSGLVLGTTAADRITANIAAGKTMDVRGAISGPGGLVKSGAGHLTLANPLTSVSSVLITGGTLVGNLDSVAAVGIAGASVYDGSLVRTAGQSFSAVVGTITGTLSLTQGAALNFDLSTHAAAQLTTGALNATGVTTIDFTNIKNGAYTIIAADSLLAGSSNFTYTVNGASLSGRNSLDLIFGANDISIYVTILNMRATWTATNGGVWDAVTSNWSTASDNCFSNGDSVRFGATASGTIAIIPSGVTAGDIEVATTGTLIFAGGALTTDADSASVDGVAGLVSLGGTTTDVTTGKLVKKGEGTLILANASGTFTGGVEINQGILSFNNAAQLDTTGTDIRFTGAAELRADADITGTSGALASDITIANTNATLNTQWHIVNYTGRLSSEGAAAALVKTGAGSLVLRATDNSAFAAPLTVAAGSLFLADSAQLGGALTVSAGATAGGDGAFTGNVTIDNSALFVGTPLDVPAPGSLTIGGDLTLIGAARVDFGIHDGGLADTLNVSGTITTDTAANVVGLSFGVISSGTYMLGNAAKLADIANLELNGVRAEPDLRMKGELAAAADGSLLFIYELDASRYMEWTGASGIARWDIAQNNWSGYNGDTSGHLKFQDGDTVRFATATDTTIDIAAAVTVSDMLVNNTGTLTFTGKSIDTGTTVSGSIVQNAAGKLVKTGEGALVFANTANTFIGGVELNAGLLAFSNTAQLNTAGVGIRFTGSGTLRTFASMTLADTVTLAGTGTGAVAAFDTGANTVTVAGKMAGTGTLAKFGAGTLVLTNTANVATIGYHIADGALQTNAAALKTSRVTTTAVGTLILDQSADITYTLNISGAGAFEKHGEGVLTLTGSLGNTGATRILGGTLKVGANNRINAASALTVGPGATLDMRGTRQSVASLNLGGALLMSATVNSTAGVILGSDYFKASQSITGNGAVNIAVTETEDTGYTFLNGSAPTSVVLLESVDNTANLTFNVTGSPADAIYGWDVTKDGGNYILGQSRIVPVIPAVAGINAAFLINSESAFDSLTRQIAALRRSEGGYRPGQDWWVNGSYRHDTINETLYAGANASTRGLQAGVNLANNVKLRGSKSSSASSWVGGVFFDYMESTMDMRDADATTTTHGGGLYLGYSHNNAFHFDAIVRVIAGNYMIQVPGVPDLKLGITGVGASVKMGYTLKTKSGWIVEPHAQFAWSTMSAEKLTDQAHRTFEVGNLNSFRERMGFEFSKHIMFGKKTMFSPSLRIAYDYEFKGTNSVSVARYYAADRTKLRDRYDYTDDFTGGSLALGGGAVLRIGNHLSLWADASAKLGGKLEDYTINLGVALHW